MTAPLSSSRLEQREKALAAFVGWFRANYPGPNTIICKPDWHAPKVFRAVEHALEAAGLFGVLPSESKLQSAPNVEEAGMPMGDPHPCDMTPEERERFFAPSSTPRWSDPDYVMVRLKDVAALTGLVPPQPVEVEGKRFQFVDPNPESTLLAAAETVKVMMKHALPVTRSATASNKG